MPSIRTISRAYLDSAKPQMLTRVGVRYINSFLIPESNIIVSDFFKINIDIPNYLSTFNGFNLLFMNTVINDDITFNIRTKFLTDALASNETGNKFILDIDCYVLPNIVPNIEYIISTANDAHDIIGSIFEEIITDKTRMLMGEEK